MPFEENNKLSEKKKGMKYAKTLEKEMRRAVFDERISKKWKEVIDKLAPNYVADQFMGPVPQDHTVDLNVILKIK